jgi:prophage DNA circulation protein
MAITDVFFSNWKKELKPASFRGVPFFVNSIETTAGRKTAVHEYPDKNINFVEDMGRATKEFSIDAYLIGKRYLEDKSALTAALEREGPGVLVHPYYGRVMVQLIGVARIRESKDEGGVAVVTMVFSESEEPLAQPSELDTLAALIDAVNATIEGVKSGFAAAFDLFQAAKNIVDDVAAAINDATVTLETVKSKGKSALDFKNQIANLRNNTSALMASADDLFESFRAIFTGDVELSAVSENLKMAIWKDNESITEPNMVALRDMVQRMAVLGAVNSIPNVTFSNKDQAEEIMTALVLAMDSIMVKIVDAGAVDNELYDQFYLLSAATIRDIQDRSITLPVLLNFTMPATWPALCLAYDLYEDVDRAEEIIEANNIRHPGFVPGGVPLEVLSRE